jgi:uncharacterized protein YndB with AHSA1/START domain
MLDEATATIYAPAERAWATLVDVERWPSWTRSVSSATALDGGPLAVGRRVRVVQPRRRPAIWTVTELDEPRRFTWSTGRPGVRLSAEHQLTPAGDAAVVVHLRLRQTGALAVLLAPLGRRMARRYLEMELSGLKAYVQAGYGVAPDA